MKAASTSVFGTPVFRPQTLPSQSRSESTKVQSVREKFAAAYKPRDMELPTASSAEKRQFNSVNDNLQAKAFRWTTYGNKHSEMNGNSTSSRQTKPRIRDSPKHVDTAIKMEHKQIILGTLYYFLLCYYYVLTKIINFHILYRKTYYNR